MPARATIAVLLAVLVARCDGVDPDVRNPCLHPLAWRTGTVDPRFDLSADELRNVVDDAIAVWERPTGHTLFRYDSAAGMPINLVYDDRQVELEGYRGRLAWLGAIQDSIERLRKTRDRSGRLLTQRLARHNAAVERWNQRGGGSAAERRRLERQEARLRELQAEVERVTAALRTAVDEHNDSILAFRSRPARRIQAGAYEETIINQGQSSIHASPRLTIYQFGDRSELLLVLAHELGHALGIPHVPHPGSLMYEEYSSDSIPGKPALDDADLAALIARCGAEAWRATRRPPR